MGLEKARGLASALPLPGEKAGCAGNLPGRHVVQHVIGVKLQDDSRFALHTGTRRSQTSAGRGVGRHTGATVRARGAMSRHTMATAPPVWRAVRSQHATRCVHTLSHPNRGRRRPVGPVRHAPRANVPGALCSLACGGAPLPNQATSGYCPSGATASHRSPLPHPNLEVLLRRQRAAP